MKQSAAQAIRESLIRAGAVAPDSKKPIPRFNARSNPVVSKLNAVLARRQECKHASA